MLERDVASKSGLVSETAASNQGMDGETSNAGLQGSVVAQNAFGKCLIIHKTEYGDATCMRPGHRKEDDGSVQQSKWSMQLFDIETHLLHANMGLVGQFQAENRPPRCDEFPVGDSK